MPAPTMAHRTDTPAVALGPTALVLGVFSVVGVLAIVDVLPPLLLSFTLPLVPIAGGLAVALGAMGIHHARRGAGRLWMCVAGTALGALGFVGVVALLCLVSV
ncbi:hypothetical protein [Streptomyces sp. Rer75]|uniref:hypothetical protein n=1 Tax=unclassified Streptomyces TaxID=2593676 RepID=UPI0015CFA78F|nr:hypothetical protein [Streptomyces sp. Rer75]QLH20431.1 hypothetical protein HYQ63_07045 [Streptomyces sp. Rer75]